MTRLGDAADDRIGAPDDTRAKESFTRTVAAMRGH
jgi:hypothetical protein